MRDLPRSADEVNVAVVARNSNGDRNKSNYCWACVIFNFKRHNSGSICHPNAAFNDNNDGDVIRSFRNNHNHNIVRDRMHPISRLFLVYSGPIPRMWLVHGT